MKNFKEYPREYELVFTNQKLFRKKYNLLNIRFLDDKPVSQEEFSDLMKTTLKNYEEVLFDTLVKYHWLKGRIRYSRQSVRGSRYVAILFLKYLNRYIGFNNNFILGRSGHRIIDYFKDFFPDFDLNNPFVDKEKYKYPYQFVTLESLALVQQMTERMKLLKIAEERKMNYAEFCDYVINYINCYNDEHRQEKYCFRIKNRDYYVSNLKREKNVYQRAQKLFRLI